jgi:hypothetical protein
MLAFQYQSALFTYVIAAKSIADASDVTDTIKINSNCWLSQWHTPDVWTRRAVDMALAPGIIDTIPRFVVDTDNGPRYVDVDVLHSVNAANLDKMRADSDTHKAWIDACLYQYIGGEPMRKYVAAIAAEGDPMRFTLKHYALATRAIAGAWGLGPIPEWHAAILPALIALNIETTDCVNAFGDDVFEMDIVELCNELSRCYSLSEHVPIWCKEALRQTMNCLAGQPTIAEIRATCLDVLTLTNWLP